MSEEIKQEGPGAATATAPKEIPIIEVDGHGGHTLEPDYKRLPIGPDHILYPVVVGLALFPILMGAAGHHLADDMPHDDTHPFFPDHFWPYPIIAITIPRPDWYFLFLFQFLKLGNEFVFSIGIGTVVIILLVIFPFLDSMFGPRIAKRLGWKKWPVPGRNIITGSIFVGALVMIALLELWALAGPDFCVPWFVNSPVCGA